MQHQTMESYIEDKKNLYTSIHEFLEESEECNEKSFQELINVIQSQQIEGKGEEMSQFLKIIKNIGENHHRDQHFNERMNRILLHYKVQIKQTLSNIEIFHIFENNKKIIYFLVKEGIMTISNEIYTEMISKVEKNGKRYWHFFIPELEKFVGEEKMKFLKDELLKEDPTIFTNYEEKRQEGENDSYICSLIRQDLVVEFITHVNRHNISPSSQISPSIFETNPFLIDHKQTTLIEYSAFFGSIQIFRYLLMNKAELRPSLWLYAIHSNNAELIHLLESTNFPRSYNNIKNYVLCFIESIKCHHNEIANYIANIFLVQKKINNQKREEIFSNCLKYHNYSYFQNEAIFSHGFFYLSYYHYNKLFELLIKKKEKSIGEKIIQYQNIQAASEKNDVEAIYYFLLKMQKISNELFKKAKITKIVIPSSVTSIGNYAFYGCSSLTQIIIPSSITSIGNYAFYGCSSLTQITIPSSITSFGNNIFNGIKKLEITGDIKYIPNKLFNGCSSLEQITIPSSVTLIGDYAFSDCSSLTQVAIPSSVTSIGNYAFSICSSLTQITIPFFVTSIGNSAFYGCLLLTQIAIPSSVISFGNHIFNGIQKLEITGDIKYIPNKLFFGCSSLEQITIPSSVTSIGDSAFSKCSSLTQITIPSSVTSIGDYAFSECSLLTQITIPSSMTSIGNYTFLKCSKLTQIAIPSSVISFGNHIFNGIQKLEITGDIKYIPNKLFFGCSSLEQITIPSSVTSIGDYAFFGCSSLTQITIPSSVTSIRYNAFKGCSSLPPDLIQFISNFKQE